MHGSLTTTSPAELCLRLAEQDTTGTIRLTGPRGNATLHLDRGRLVDVRTSTTRRGGGRRVGDRLVTAGKLTRGDLDTVLADQEAMPDRTVVGTLLVDRGVVARAHVRLAVLEQLLENLVEMLEWHDGEYDVEVEESVPEPGVPVSVPMDQALTEAHRRIAERDRIEHLVPDPATVLHPGPAEATPLEPDERAVLDLVDGQRTAASLADELGMVTDDVARLLYRLSLQGLVEAADDHSGRPDTSEEADTVTTAPGNTAVTLDDQGWAERRTSSTLADEPEPWVGYAHGAPEPEPEPATAGAGAGVRDGGAPLFGTMRSHGAAPEPAAASRAATRTSSAPARSLDADTRQALFSELHQVSHDETVDTPAPASPRDEPPAEADRPTTASSRPEPDTPVDPPASARPRERDGDDADVSELLRELHALSLDDD